MSESQLLPFNFGGIAESKHSDVDAARILVWPIPYEGTVSYGRGTADGPRAIIEASRNMELYDEEMNESIYRRGIHTLPPLKVLPEPQEMMEQIEEEAQRLLRTGKFLVTLGGEHSISGPIIRALGQLERDLSVLQIDAHADLRESYDGTPHSHTSIMARVVEVCPVVQVGIRSISENEAKRLAATPTTIFWARDIIGRTDWCT